MTTKCLPKRQDLKKINRKYHNKREQHVLKRRNVPAQDSTDSDEIEKLPNQSLKTIVENAASEEPNVQLSAVQAAR
jgi:hypothetical protein